MVSAFYCALAGHAAGRPVLGYLFLPGTEGVSFFLIQALARGEGV